MLFCSSMQLCLRHHKHCAYQLHESLCIADTSVLDDWDATKRKDGGGAAKTLLIDDLIILTKRHHTSA